jgi:hypothetical protein
MNKLLLTIFTILFTVLVFEFGYFFGMERMKTQVVKGAPQFEEKSISIITMVKSFFTDGQNGKLSNLNLSYTYTGTIEKVSFEPQKIASGDFAFAPTEAAASIYIKTKDGTSRGFYFYESELANIKFLEKSKGGKLQEITHSSFKTGDKASLTTIINLLRPPTDNLIKVELIKNP